MGGFRIGRAFGVELRVAWSWVLIFALLTRNLVAIFSHWHQDWPSLEVMLTAGAASLAFFACIVLHELAHSLVAMGYGIRVRSITLFLFGGVSNIENEPPSPGAEFLIALAGPITSIVLGAVFSIIAAVVTFVPLTGTRETLDAVAQLGPLATLLAWLGPINIVIGLFNLIPGFPLDGGRVLRSILWKATGDMRGATRSASLIGQTIGWLLIAGGIAMTFGVRLPFFGTGFGSGLWLAFIGWFLHNAALREAARAAIDDALAGMTVEQLMQRHGPVATPELSVAALVHEHLIPGDDRGLPVVRGGALVGLVSISDVRRLRSEQWASTPVESIMRRLDALTVAHPDESLATAFGDIAKRDVDQLPVVDNGVLVGMLRRRDVTRWLELAWKPAAGRGLDVHHRPLHHGT
jgi:Zn-dependent protease